MAQTACPSTKPVKIGGATVKECGGGAAFWNTLSWDLLIIPQQDATQLSQLTRISHHLTAKARDRCATTSLRSIVVLDGLSSTPPRANRRPPRIDGPLTHFRSLRGEKCGLTLRLYSRASDFGQRNLVSRNRRLHRFLFENGLWHQ